MRKGKFCIKLKLSSNIMMEATEVWFQLVLEMSLAGSRNAHNSTH